MIFLLPPDIHLTSFERSVSTVETYLDERGYYGEDPSEEFVSQSKTGLGDRASWASVTPGEETGQQMSISWKIGSMINPF